MTILMDVMTWFESRPAVALLVIAMVLDVVTGLLRAWQDKKISSDISGKGMRRKATMLVLVLLGFSLEYYAKIGAVADVIAYGFCLSEALSIFENAALLGVKVPKVLQDAFQQLAARTTKSDAKMQRNDVITDSLDHIDEHGLG